MKNSSENNKALFELAFAKMPFGKYKNQYLSDIPESYYIWFRQKGFPKGKLGQQMQAVFEMKINGIEPILRKVRKIKTLKNQN